jgi:RNA polymerase sigma-70 factor (ECF subfamily)
MSAPIRVAGAPAAGSSVYGLAIDSHALSIDERRLVVRAQAGDRDAFEDLVRMHADRLFAVVLRLCASRHEAEEVTQEAFLRAWRGLGGFDGRSQFFTWLYRIGINEAKRRAGRRETTPLTVPIDETPVGELRDVRETPESRAQQRDLRFALEEAVRALPLAYRAPLILRDIEGLSTREAAELLGLGEAAFKSRLYRARLSVRDAIRDREHEVREP